MPFTMERREHYDPEDIERLLQERDFDQLLEEERAYVLRHLESRNEYESMRALLHQVRNDDQPAVEADDDVREHVMRAFRQEHRPQWQIWLNSVAALLRPQEGMAMPMLRPALVVATLALLVTAGVWVMKQSSTSEDQPLAELKAKPTAAAAEVERAASEPAEKQAKSLESSEVSEQLNRAAPASAQEFKTVQVEEDASSDLQSANSASVAKEPLLAKDMAPVRADKSEYEEVAKNKKEIADSDVAVPVNEDRMERIAAAAPQSHVVTEAELARNYSVANATGKVTTTVSSVATPAMTGNLAASPEVLALLATGW